METTLDFLPSKLVIPGDIVRLPGVLAQVRTRFGSRVNAFISKPIFLEVLPPHADKGEALKWVANSLGIPATDILAIGDAANDLGMLRYAGHSVAMANAIAELKAVAKSVTAADHDHDGVAEVIESVLKGV
jgi:hydroxymethylpyrimidine pyrophosphatase-like HAD family hydrolase